MSTRAHIRIVDGNNVKMLYRHCDGRPGDLGKAIQRYLDRLKLWDTDKITAKLIGGLKYWDRKGLIHRIEKTDCLHGDENYVYIINIEDKTLQCYEHWLDESFENCCNPIRLRKIN